MRTVRPPRHTNKHIRERDTNDKFIHVATGFAIRPPARPSVRVPVLGAAVHRPPRSSAVIRAGESARGKVDDVPVKILTVLTSEAAERLSVP